VLRYLFFRLIDDAWRLPTRQEFARRAAEKRLPGWDKKDAEQVVA
jgi:hypothetical protein